jgi:hypothetical protein
LLQLLLDPEGSGPDTHYKVLQATAEALKLYEKETGINTLKFGDIEMFGIVSILLKQIFSFRLV